MTETTGDTNSFAARLARDPDPAEQPFTLVLRTALTQPQCSIDQGAGVANERERVRTPVHGPCPNALFSWRSRREFGTDILSHPASEFVSLLRYFVPVL